MGKSSNAVAIPRREYGRTGIMLSVLGFGGIMVKDQEQAHADRLVADAVERGVNYFEVAPSYGDAEEKLGVALQPHRKNVFLACKTLERKREGAEAELKASLKRLRADHFDLYQLHALKYVDKEVDVVFSSGGAMEALVAAKKSGQVRHLGFTAHTEDAAIAAMERYDFDSVLFPVNFACWYRDGFGSRIMAKARVAGVTRLAIKTFARQVWPADDPDRKKFKKCWYQPITDPREAELSLKFTLSQPVTVAISSGEEAIFRLALDAVARFKPITPAEEAELKSLAVGLKPIFRVE